MSHWAVNDERTKYLMHAGIEGMHRKNHKYIAIVNGRYIYPEDKAKANNAGSRNLLGNAGTWVKNTAKSGVSYIKGKLDAFNSKRKRGGREALLDEAVNAHTELAKASGKELGRNGKTGARQMYDRMSDKELRAAINGTKAKTKKTKEANDARKTAMAREDREIGRRLTDQQMRDHKMKQDFQKDAKKFEYEKNFKKRVDDWKKYQESKKTSKPQSLHRRGEGLGTGLVGNGPRPNSGAKKKRK